jgi:hypothetical protein
VCWDLSYNNLTGTPIMAHIHKGAAGVAGPVVIALTTDDPADPPFSDLGAHSATGCRDLTPTEETAAGDIVGHPANYYVNVHTTDFTAGAERGQLAEGAPPSGEAHLLPTPLRAYDSREAVPVSKLLPGAAQTRTISLATGHLLGSTAAVLAVPPGATGAIITLTVTETNGGPGGNGGFLKIYSAASPEPATSNINWAGADQNVAVSTQVAVDASGMVKVTGGANATHFVIDVIGYLY